MHRLLLESACERAGKLCPSEARADQFERGRVEAGPRTTTSSLPASLCDVPERAGIQSERERCEVDGVARPSDTPPRRRTSRSSRPLSAARTRPSRLASHPAASRVPRSSRAPSYAPARAVPGSRRRSAPASAHRLLLAARSSSRRPRARARARSPTCVAAQYPLRRRLLLLHLRILRPPRPPSTTTPARHPSPSAPCASPASPPRSSPSSRPPPRPPPPLPRHTRPRSRRTLSSRTRANDPRTSRSSSGP